MPKFLKVSLLAVGTLFLVVLLMGVATVLYLQTPHGARFLMSQAEKQVVKTGGELHYTAVRFAPFSHLYLENLRFTQSTGKSSVEFSARVIDLQYRISWWRRQIRVEVARVVEPKLNARTDATQDKTTPVEKASASDAEGLQTLQTWIASPWVEISAPAMTLENASASIEQIDASGRTNIQVPSLGMRMAFELSPALISASAEISTPKPIEMQGDLSGVKSAWKTSASTSLNGAFGIRYNSERKDWSYEVQPSEFRFDTGKTTWSQPESRGELAQSHFKSSAHLTARTKKLFQFEPGSISALRIESKLDLGALRAQQGKQSFSFRSQQASFRGDWTEALRFQAEMSATQLVAGETFRSPASIRANAELSVSPDFKTASGKGRLTLDGASLADAQIEIGTGDKISAKVMANSRFDRAWLSRFRANTRPLEGIVGHAELSADVRAPALHLLALPLTRLSKADLEAKARAWTPSAKLPGATHAASLSLENQVLWRPATHRAQLESDLKLQSESALKLKSEVELSPGKGIRAHILLDAVSAQAGRLFGVAQQGDWSVHSEADIDLENTVDRGKSSGKVRFQGKTSIAQSVSTGVNPILVLRSPVSLDHQIELSDRHLAAQLNASLPEVEVPGVAKLASTRFKTSLQSPDLSEKGEIEGTVDVEQGQVTVLSKAQGFVPPLEGLKGKIRARIHHLDQFQLEVFDLGFHKSTLQFTAQANGRLKQKNFQASGMASLRIPQDFPEVAGHAVRGAIEFPWTLSIVRGNAINLEGHVDLKQFAWAKAPMRVTGIHGRIPVSEKLVREGAGVAFAYRINQNPFQRVDYERLRPLIDRTDRVRIEEIVFEDRKFGPWIGFLSMRQNMLFAHQFDFTIGKKGAAYGEAFFNFYPRSLQLGFLTRLTALDLSEVLPQRLLTRIPAGDKTLSGRTGLVFDLNRGSVDGRADLTEVGASQLLILVGAMDPKYEDNKMNQVRTALGLGYPTFVQMVLQKGYLDMGVEIRALGISQRFDVRSIPISTWVSSATSGLAKRAKATPLKPLGPVDGEGAR